MKCSIDSYINCLKWQTIKAMSHQTLRCTPLPPQKKNTAEDGTHSILVLTFKILYSDAPGYLCELLNWYHPTRHLRSANTTLLVPSRSKTVKLGRRLMDTAAATLWNTLPDGINCSPSVMI